MHTFLRISFSYPAVFPIKTFITKEYAPEGNIQSSFILMGMGTCIQKNDEKIMVSQLGIRKVHYAHLHTNYELSWLVRAFLSDM